MTRLTTTFLAVALAVPLGAQQQPAPVFRSGAQLTVETVTVKDKDGRPIEGLTAKDFSITEDGVPQAISFVEFQRVQSAANPSQTAPAPASAAAPAVAPDAARAPASVAPRVPDAQYQISSSAQGDIRYRDRRLLVLYFDL